MNGQDPFADFTGTPKGQQGWDVKITTVRRADGSTSRQRLPQTDRLEWRGLVWRDGIWKPISVCRSHPLTC